MDAKQLVTLALQVSILCTVFGFGLRTPPDGLLYLARRPGLLLRSILSIFVVVPVFAVTMVRLVDLRHATEIALVALVVSPIPPLLPGREAKAGGHHFYGVALMGTLALLAIAAVPLGVEVLERVFGQSFVTPVPAIVRAVVVVAILPLVAGMAVRARRPAMADSIEKPVRLVARVLLALTVVVMLTATWPAVWAAVGDGTVLAMVAFVVVGLAAGHLLGGPDPEESAVLALSSACRHPAIAFSLASSNFPDERVGGTILLYVIVGWIASVPYIVWRRRHAPGAISPA
jgi:BASS family bile acid:Na+ symporter